MKTIIEIVQDILNDMDGDEVNSISDTTESLQVAEIVKSTYDAMMANRDWPHTKKLITLVPFTDNSLPTHVEVNRNVKRLLFVNYDMARAGDTRKKFGPVTYKEPDAFLRMLNGRNDAESNVDVIQDPSGVTLNIRNDIPPTYYTSFDDRNLVFDSYDSDVDDTIQEQKIQAMGYIIPKLILTDDAIPDLPEEAFPRLIEEAKSRASLKLRQVQDVKSEQESARQDRWLARNVWTVKGGIKYPNYGRRGKK
jgi:hypothetical protein